MLWMITNHKSFFRPHAQSIHRNMCNDHKKKSSIIHSYHWCDRYPDACKSTHCHDHEDKNIYKVHTCTIMSASTCHMTLRLKSVVPLQIPVPKPLGDVTCLQQRYRYCSSPCTSWLVLNQDWKHKIPQTHSNFPFSFRFKGFFFTFSILFSRVLFSVKLCWQCSQLYAFRQQECLESCHVTQADNAGTHAKATKFSKTSPRKAKQTMTAFNLTDGHI